MLCTSSRQYSHTNSQQASAGHETHSAQAPCRTGQGMENSHQDPKALEPKELGFQSSIPELQHRRGLHHIGSTPPFRHKLEGNTLTVFIRILHPPLLCKDLEPSIFLTKPFHKSQGRFQSVDQPHLRGPEATATFDSIRGGGEGGVLGSKLAQKNLQISKLACTRLVKLSNKTGNRKQMDGESAEAYSGKVRRSLSLTLGLGSGEVGR